MKTVTVMECPEVGLEGLDSTRITASIKTTWHEFKKFVGFDDETKTKQRLKDLEGCVKDLQAIKRKVSSAGKDESINVNLLKAMGHLPIKGSTGSQIAKSLTKHRQDFQKLVNRIDKVDTKDQLDVVKADIKALTSEKFDLPEKVSFNRQDLLHINDELILITELEMEVIKKGMKFKSSNVSTENYAETIEAVALESFFSKVGAVLLGMLGVWSAIQTYQCIFLIFYFAALGGWAFALTISVSAVMWGFTTVFLIEQAHRYWKQE